MERLVHAMPVRARADHIVRRDRRNFGQCRGFPQTVRLDVPT
jgi:hypothetical protein